MIEPLSSTALEAAFDASLSDFLDARSAELTDAAVLIDEIRTLIGSGGKRLRPSFCYWGYRAAGGSHDDHIVAAAASLELLHSFALIHDDVMDAAEMRRGRPTVTASHGTSVAILAGDLALVLADEAFWSSGFSDERITRAFGAYSRMRQEVIAGQLLDITSSSRMPSIDDARRIALLKSGRYTVAEPLRIGVSLAGGSENLNDALGTIGDLAGEAFQLRDDLLGTFGSSAPTGKATDSDIRQGKRHFLFAHAAETLAGTDRQWFLSAWGGHALEERDVERARQLLVEAGSRKAAEDLIDDLHQEARRLLESVTIDPLARDAIARLIDRAIFRDE